MAAAVINDWLKELQIGGLNVKALLIGGLALLLLVVSALGVNYSSYKNRQLFSELQKMKSETIRLEEEWGRLLLEQSTWASHSRIEGLAKSKLNMVVPDPVSIVLVQ